MEQTDIWAPLAEGQVPRVYAPGQLIYLQGTRAEVFYYLLSGTARSYISSETGGERVLTTHRSGDLMGEAAFFDGCPRVSSAVAVTECKVVSIDRTGVELPDGRHFLADLMGLEVRDADTGEVLGQVADVLTLPANNVYVVRGGAREWMIPAVDQFVAEINVDANYMRVHRMEGL